MHKHRVYSTLNIVNIGWHHVDMVYIYIKCMVFFFGYVMCLLYYTFESIRIFASININKAFPKRIHFIREIKKCVDEEKRMRNIEKIARNSDMKR